MSDENIKHNEAVAERLAMTLNIMLGIVNILETMYGAKIEPTIKYDISLKDLESKSSTDE